LTVSENSENCHAFALTSKANGNMNLWIADTGASRHMTCSDQGMFNWKDINEDIKVGDGKSIKAKKMGSICVNVSQPGGVAKEFVITECKYVPKLWTNLFSVPSTLRRGWQLSNDGIIMSLTKQGETLVLDQVLNTTSGAITVVIMRPVTYPNLNVGVELKTPPVQDTVQDTV
jgi:hypothetical protein